MTYQTISVENEPSGVCTLTLNRPQARNAFDYQMMLDLEAAVADIRKDDNVHSLIITGAGSAFCGGGDVKLMEVMREWTPYQLKEYVRRYSRIGVDLWEMEKPVIMAVNGAAVGGGCNFALLGDIVIASEEARFAEFFVLRGLIPDFCAFYTLPRLVGYHKAMELCLTGDLIDAHEAARVGLINRVVPHEELMPTARALAEKLAGGPPLAAAMCKTLMHKGMDGDTRAVLEFEGFGQGLALCTEDHHEAVRAYFEKREPVYKGR